MTLNADVAGLLKDLKIEALHGWIGDSMGAATGIIFVTQNPGIVKKLALSDTLTTSPSNAGVEDLFGASSRIAKNERGQDCDVNRANTRAVVWSRVAGSQLS